MLMTEHEIMNRIQVALCERGCKVFRSNTGNFYTKGGNRIQIYFKGFSDLHGVRPDGKAFFIECKTATGKPSQEQLRFLAEMRKTNAIAGICRSVEDALSLIFSNTETESCKGETNEY